jgi:hypothetical protein
MMNEMTSRRGMHSLQNGASRSFGTPRTALVLALASILPAVACKKNQCSEPGASCVPDDGGHIIVYYNDGGRDGGADGGPDAGDSGIVIIPDGGAVPCSLTRAAPDRGPTAGGTPVNLTGIGFQSGLVPSDPGLAAQETTVTFGGNPALSLTILSDDTIQVVAPAGAAGAADIVLTNPNTVASSTGSPAVCTGCFTYQPPVQLTSVSPSRGPLTGGSPTITLRGLGFDSSTIVLVGSHAALGVTVAASDPTTLTATPPPGSIAGPVDVRIFNSNGVASLHDAFTYFEPLALGAVAPPAAPLAGGTPLTITGKGFAGTSPSLTFGGTAATGLIVVSDTTLTATAPAATQPGPVDVVLADSDGQVTLHAGFVYYDPTQTQLTVLGVVPAAGSTAGGTNVTIVGNGFSQSGAVSVTVGGAAATSVVAVNDNLITAVTPPGSGVASVSVTVGSNTATLPAGFTYELVPVVTAVTPGRGPTSGGTAITVTGSGFETGDTLYIGALAATVSTLSASSISATTPPGTAGANDVRVVSVRDPQLVGILTGGFVYDDAFQLVQLSPTSGAQAGGTYVVLFGTGLQPGTSAKFAGNAATDVQLIDAYTLSCHTPPGNPGAVDVSATPPGTGSTGSTLPAAFSYFDPTNTQGGSSGGPLDGTLNVTVLDNDFSAYQQPIPGVTVRLGVDPHTPFQGITDAHGQITFSDPTLVKAQTVTASFGAQNVTVDGVTRQNLTLYLSVPMGSGGGGNLCPCSPPGQAPNCPMYCGLQYCTPFGCVQCLTDMDCQNPALPAYNAATPYCNQGFCVACVQDSQCDNDPNGNHACDTNRGTASTFTCVQCNSNSFCTPPQYCNQQSDTCAAPDVISGNVYGFKLPPSLVLTSTQVAEAHVGVASASSFFPGSSVYYLEPFNPGGVVCTSSGGGFCEHVLQNDGDPFTFVFNAGAQEVTLYAKFGVADYGVNPPTFTPYLLGLARKISVDPQHPASGISLILDTPLDQSAPITLQNTLDPPPSLFVGPTGRPIINFNPVQYDTYAYLDLGQDGIVPLNHALTTDSQVTVYGLPHVEGNGVLFMTQAFQDPPAASGRTFTDPSQRFPTSNFFRRVQTDFISGVSMGPLLAFASPLHPVVGGKLDGTFSWSFQGSTPPVGPPDISQVTAYWYWLQNGQLVSNVTSLWQIVVSGSQTQVQVPPDQLASSIQAITPLDPSIQLQLVWVIQTAHAPRFDFNFWSYQDLNNLDWTSFQATEVTASP